MKTSGSFLAAGPCRPLHILWRPHKHPAAWEITGKYPGDWWQSHFKILSTYFILYCRPTTADAIMFGYIAPLLRINFPRNRLKGHIESYQNIIQTIDFILRRYFQPSARGMFCVQLNVFSQFSPSVQCMDEVYDILGCHPDHLLNYCMHLHTFSDCFCCHEGRDRQLAEHTTFCMWQVIWNWKIMSSL